MNSCLFKKIFAIIILIGVSLPACTDGVPLKVVWRAPDAAAQTENPIIYSVESVTRGKKLFDQHCQKCHGYWGEGNGVVGLSLNKRPANLLRLAGKKAEGEFAWKIAEGRGDMPGFKGVLSEEDIWNIVNFVQSLENEEGSADPVAIK